MTAGSEIPQFARIVRMVGSAGLERLASSRVVVLGLGAVGGYTVEALARSGVGMLRLVDHDRVQPTNLNRQLYALASTVGRPKAELAAERVADINPRAVVEPLATFVNQDTAEELLCGVDLVVDAIDSLNPKIALLDQAHRMGVPVVSSMGAALRVDPLAIRVGPISRTEHCPLARLVRKRLRNRGSQADPWCVWSSEQLEHLPPEAIGAPEDHDGTFRGRQRNVLGSLPTLTGIFGLTVANEALRLLLADHWPTRKKKR